MARTWKPRSTVSLNRRGDKVGCTTDKERRITRWEHEHVVEAVARQLDENPEMMRTRRETVEHPFGTIKSWMGSTHFQMKMLKRVGTELAPYVLAYNLKRVMNILGFRPLIAAAMDRYRFIFRGIRGILPSTIETVEREVRWRDDALGQVSGAGSSPAW